MHDGCACVCAAFSQLCSRLGVPTEFAAWHVAGAARCVPLAEKRSQESREGRHPASPGDLQLNSPRLHPVPPRAPWGVAAWRLLQRLWADIVAICGLPEAGASHGMVQVSVITLSYLHSPPHPQPPNPYSPFTRTTTPSPATSACSRLSRPSLARSARAQSRAPLRQVESYGRAINRRSAVSGRIRSYQDVSGRIRTCVGPYPKSCIRPYQDVSGRIRTYQYQAVSGRIRTCVGGAYQAVWERITSCGGLRIRTYQSAGSRVTYQDVSGRIGHVRKPWSYQCCITSVSVSGSYPHLNLQFSAQGPDTARYVLIRPYHGCSSYR